MNHWAIIDLVKSETVPITEPVTLSEAKGWLKVTFSDDDIVITNLIKSAREAIEEWCSISLVNKKVTAIVDLRAPNNRECIQFELPYGQIVFAALTDISVYKNNSGDSNDFEILTINTDYKLTGIEFLKFESNVCGRYKFVYTVGPIAIAARLKEAILTEIAHRYENRGDVDEEPVCLSARKKAQPYKRMTWL